MYVDLVMRTLKIGMRGLPASDEQLIRNLMRMCDGPALDVLVMDASTLAESKPRCCYRAALLLSDSSMPNDEHVLARPLQATAFRAWLIRAEQALAPNAASAQPIRLPARPAQRSHNLHPQTRKPLYKLRSWPPAIMLRGDPVLARMVQLLTADAFAMSDLAQLSGAPVEACQTFLRKLQLLGLLDISLPQAPATSSNMLPIAGPVKISLGARLGLARERVKRVWA